MPAIQPLIARNSCIRCKGLKNYMGLGGIKQVCDCEEHAKRQGLVPKIVVDKRSKEFKKAVKEMKDTNPELTEEKAEKLLQEALDKG